MRIKNAEVEDLKKIPSMDENRQKTCIIFQREAKRKVQKLL